MVMGFTAQADTQLEILAALKMLIEEKYNSSEITVSVISSYWHASSTLHPTVLYIATVLNDMLKYRKGIALQ